MNLFLEEVSNFIDNYKTSFKEGISSLECLIILNKYNENIDSKKFYEALRGVTCLKIKNQIVYYRHDVENAIKYAIK